MFSPYNEYLLNCIVKDTAARHLREAKVYHLLNERREHRPNELAHHFGGLLQNLKSMVVAFRRGIRIHSAGART